MLRDIHKRFLHYRQCYAVEAKEGESDRWDLRVVKVVLSKGQLTFQEQHSKVESFAELFRILSTNLPVVLVITGRSIVTGKLGGTDQSDSQILNDLLPDAKREDFFLQSRAIEDGMISCTIRKSKYDSLVKRFEDGNAKVVAIYLGGLVLVSILKLMNLSKERLEIAGHELTLKDGKLYDYKALEIEGDTSLQIGEDFIESRLAVSLAAGFLFHKPSSVLKAIETIATRKGIEELLYMKVFKTLATSFAALLLTSLLVNHVLYSQYSERIQDASMEWNAAESITAEVGALRRAVEQKEELIREYNFESPSKTAFIADRIGSLLPNRLRLTRVLLHPAIKIRSRSTKRTFKQDEVIVTGFAADPVSLHQWVGLLQNEDWVSEVSISNYTADIKKKAGNFSIEILIQSQER